MCIRIVMALAFLFSSTAFAAVDFKLVRELDKINPWPGMSFSGDKLYTSDMNEDYAHIVEIYNADGSKHLKTIYMKHSVIHMAPYGDKGVIAVGRTSKAWGSHATIISDLNGRFAVKHYNLGESVIVESSVSNGHDIYFNEKGQRGLYKLQNGRLKRLPVEISGPGKNMKISEDGKLYVVELRDLFSPGDESVVEYNTNTGVARRLTDMAQLYGLRNIAIVDGMIAGTETYSDEVVFIDLESDKVFGRAKVKAGAYGIATFGKCAAVLSDKTKTIAFFRAGDDEVELVGGWDLNPAGDRLRQPRSLAIDENTGRIFVRSNYTCSSCTVTQSSVFVFDDGGKMLEACQ